MPYLFVHFKEKTTPDGEQVYFGLSRDGRVWQQTLDGQPVLTARLGEQGCRDIEVVRTETGFVILTTDLAIARRAARDGHIDWKQINSHGSKCLRMWKTPDLVHFSEERLIHFGRDDFGCLWAPEVVYDDRRDSYVIHWGSTLAQDDYRHMSIFYTTTRDFERFALPKLFFTKDCEILDTHIRRIGDRYHMFYKNAHDPSMNLYATSSDVYGPWLHDEGFAADMALLDAPGAYEGPTTITLPDGQRVLLLDFFGCEKEKMGYVPFRQTPQGWRMDKSMMTFPYGYKHGGVLTLTENEYERLAEAYL